MRLIRIFIYLTAVMSLASCMNLEESSSDNASHHYVTGMVYDADDNVIEHIKITIEWESIYEPTVNYTASDGSFRAEIPDGMDSERIEFKIRLEDIDGQENRGLFETKTDKVIYNLNLESPTGFLVYHLNRATASESSPQS